MDELDNFDEDIENAEQNFELSEVNGDDSESEPLQRGADEGDAERPQAKEMALGLHEGISNAEYHAGGGISSTQLKQELKASAYYKAFDCGELTFTPTRQMRLGVAVHCLTLEPFLFDEQIALLPKNCQGNTKNAKPNKAEFLAENRGKDYIHIQDMDIVSRMRDSLMIHPEASELLTQPDRQCEVSGYCLDFDEETGVGTHMLQKYRPDLRLDWAIADIKSTVNASPEAFSRTIADFCYDISAAHYLECDRLITGTDHRRFYFLAVESSPPFLTAVYVLDEVGLQVGEWRRRKALYSIAQCRRKQEWKGINADLVTEIGVPNYLSYAMNQEIN